MNQRQTLMLVQELVMSGSYRITKSARIGMRAHGIRTSDVLCILAAADSCNAQRNLTWRVEGEAPSNGCEVRILFRFQHLTQVVVISAHLIVEKGL